MNNGITALVANAHHGEAQAVQAPEQQPQVGVQQEQGLGLQPIAQNRLLESLPDDQLRNVVVYLQGGHDTVRDINALATLSKTSMLRNAITRIPPDNDVLSRFHLLDRTREAINLSLNELAVHHNQGSVPYVVGCGPILELLSPAVRSTFVQRAIDTTDDLKRGKAIADLSLGMAHLTPEERMSLVFSAFEFDDDDNVQGNQLSGLAIALAGLLEGRGSLTQECRQELLDRADRLVWVTPAAGQPATQLNNNAVAQLGAAIRFLPPEKIARIVDSSVNEPHHPTRAIALANLGVIMSHVPGLDADERIVTAVLQLNDGASKNRAITSLAARIGAMQPQHSQQIIDTALNITDDLWRARAARQLAAKAEHLSDAQREFLVELATPLNAAFLNEQARSCIRVRLLGLAAGMQHLNVLQRDRLAATVLGFTDLLDKPLVIGVLAQGLGYLQDTRRAELVSAAIDNPVPYGRAEGIARLGAGARHLDNGQRNRLIDALVAINAPAAKATKVSALSVIAASISAEVQPS